MDLTTGKPALKHFIDAVINRLINAKGFLCAFWFFGTMIFAFSE